MSVLVWPLAVWHTVREWKAAARREQHAARIERCRVQRTMTIRFVGDTDAARFALHELQRQVVGLNIDTEKMRWELRRWQDRERYAVMVARVLLVVVAGVLLGGAVSVVAGWLW